MECIFLKRSVYLIQYWNPSGSYEIEYNRIFYSYEKACEYRNHLISVGYKTYFEEIPISDFGDNDEDI